MNDLYEIENQIWFTAKNCVLFNTEWYDLIWSEDFSKFRAVKLRWIDDSTYAHYQSDCDDMNDY